MTGLKRIIYNAVIAFSQRNITTFDDREAAMRWLAVLMPPVNKPYQSLK